MMLKLFVERQDILVASQYKLSSVIPYNYIINSVDIFNILIS